MEHDRNLEDGETIPGGGLCKTCGDLLSNWKQVLDEGGKVIRCSSCNSLGVLAKDSKMLAHLNKEGQINAGSLGIDISPESCPRCFMRNLREPFGTWEIDLIESLYKTGDTDAGGEATEKVASGKAEDGLEVRKPAPRKARKAPSAAGGRGKKSKER